MDIGKAFSFVFEDKNWVVKVLIGIAVVVAGFVSSCLLIPAILAGIMLSGYSLEITRRVIRGDADVLPAWDDWGQFLVDGLMVTIITVVYALPIIILGLCVGIPASLIADSRAVSLSAGEAYSVFASSSVGCFGLLWAIVMSLLLPAAIGRFAAEGELASAFQLGEVFSLVRDNLGTYLLTAVMVLATGIMASLGLLLCFVGVLFTSVYAELVSGHLYGQAYLEATRQTPQAVAD